MCGIFGIASNSANLKNFPIQKFTDTLSHRGPDGSGYYADDRVALGHRRLSIIDLAGGGQPIFNEDGSMCIIFNGEIYNFQDLRKTLINKGHTFSTRSDTETILHAYEEWGEKCVEYLRGMFAFAIWDSKNETIFLARDRLGIKPLFYAETAGSFLFASEMKAILAVEDFPRDIDEMALACYFTLSYIPAPLTIYKGIRKLLPGHCLLYKNGNIRINKYWDLYFVPNIDKSEKHVIEDFMGLLEEAVKIRLMSEVPLGAFLSGGIDSSTVVALMSGGNPVPTNTFCIGFGGETGGYLDERQYAQMVAEKYSTNHKHYEVLPTPGGLLEKIVHAFDEPFADDSTIPSYFVCKVARENVTVALSGLGGDEAFAGYERYLGFRLRELYRFVPSFLRKRVIPTFIDRLPERADGHYTINHMKRFARSGAMPSDRSYFDYMTILSPGLKPSFFNDPERFNKQFKSCEEMITGHFNSSNIDGSKDSLNRALYCDIKTYLPDDILAVTDRMSMHHSLEVRVPFVDHRLLELCATIPPELKMKWLKKKYLLKKGAKSILPLKVLNHRKQGFVGPMAQWLKNDLNKYVLKTLSQKNLGRHNLFNYNTVQLILDEHFSGKQIHDTLIWSLLVFQKWFAMYIEKSSDQMI